jgi:molecular chaperone GrpE
LNKKEKDTEKKPKQKAQAKEETSKANETEEKEEDVKKEEKDPVQQELDDTKDRLLRLTAEYSNYKRRSEKEKQDAYVYAKSDTIKALLPVIDNLERALANETKDYDALKKGVEMTFDNLTAILETLGVEVFGEPGDIFDPNLHNAVMHVEDEELKNGEIVDVFQKGYKIGDKIVRPAMVKSAN